MSDPFDRLKDELGRATPRPDPDARARTLAQARKIFDETQDNAAPPRPISNSPQPRARFGERIRTMLASLGPRGALGATTALVAVGILLTLPNLNETLTPPGPVGGTLGVSEQAVPTPPADAVVVAEEAAEADRAFPGALTRSAPKGMDQGVGIVAAPAPMFAEPVPAPEIDTEAYANAEANPLKVTAEDPISTFSVDVDTASWAIIRSSLNLGQLPPRDAVRIEEMVNYFTYDYAAPEAGGAPFRPTVSVMETPWNPGTRLVRIGIQGDMPAVADRPPLNLVFLIDTSGSMQDANKLPLLIQSLRMMLGELRPGDEVAIVTYAGSAGVALEPVAATDRRAIEGALSGLTAAGSTAGQAGLEEAYALAERMTGDGEVSRILLATDGDFNVGIDDPEALERYIADKRESGTYLSVLGFGRGNLDDATMQALAQTGNGTAAYIDTLAEARKVLVDQLTGALFPIADDVKVQVEFNPATVAEYRLIGYETRALRREDFANDKVDAGEIGAGHQVTALYEVTPVGSDAVLTDPLRYGTGAAPAAGPEDELGFLRLRWKAPGSDTSALIEQPIGTTVTQGDADFRFAAAIAGFGQILRDGAYVGDWSIGDAIRLAEGALGEDRFGWRREAVTLMRIAETLDG